MSQTREKGMTEDRRSQRRTSDDRWRTALTGIEPNKIILRGYPLDEVMGRLTFGEAIYLLLMGEVPSPALGRLMEAMLVSFIDHGATPPSTLAARNTATTGAALRACVAADTRLRQIPRRRHRKLHAVPGYRTRTGAKGRVLSQRRRADRPAFGRGRGDPAGIWPPVPYRRDPRAARLFQMALELEAEAEHIQMIRAVENVLHEKPEFEALPVNIDGAIAAVCGDIGIPPTVANALFIISRVPDRGARRRRARASTADAADRSEGPPLRRPVRTPAAGETQVGIR